MTRDEKISELKVLIQQKMLWRNGQRIAENALSVIEELQAENEKLKEKLETAKSHIIEAKYYLDQNGLDEQDKKNGLDFIDEAINLLNNNQNNNE
jgi:hypothetical protein